MSTNDLKKDLRKLNKEIKELTGDSRFTSKEIDGMKKDEVLTSLDNLGKELNILKMENKEEVMETKDGNVQEVNEVKDVTGTPEIKEEVKEEVMELNIEEETNTPETLEVKEESQEEEKSGEEITSPETPKETPKKEKKPKKIKTKKFIHCELTGKDYLRISSKETQREIWEDMKEVLPSIENMGLTQVQEGYLMGQLVGYCKRGSIGIKDNGRTEKIMDVFFKLLNDSYDQFDGWDRGLFKEVEREVK